MTKDYIGNFLFKHQLNFVLKTLQIYLKFIFLIVDEPLLIQYYKVDLIK